MPKKRSIVWKTIAELEAMSRDCAWAGCTATYQGDQPPNWNSLMVFWSPGPVLNFAEINPHFQLRERAFHEAGHAGAARALGVTVEHISMRPRADSGASVLAWSAFWMNRDADIATRIRAAETDAMIAIAGMIAKKRYLRKKTEAQPAVT